MSFIRIIYANAMQLARRSIWSTYTLIEPSTCLRCQCRSFNSSRQRYVAKSQTSPSPTPSSLDEAPRRYGKSVDEFTPKPLNRPIGLSYPPRSGQNTGIDTRSWRQKRDDIVNYDKHLQRRKELKKKMSAPYFRDWSNMRYSKGKTFLATPGVFKAQKSLYFPNLAGRTLLNDGIARDTTPILEDKVSVVSVFSSRWAEKQVSDFVGSDENPALHKAVQECDGIAQLVHINVEEDVLKATLLRMFISSLRRRFAQDNWNKYFIVTKGLTDDLKEEIAYFNSKVGYIYLLDGDCKIRWAACAMAEGTEKEDLIKAMRKLVLEWRDKHRRRSNPGDKGEDSEKGGMLNEASTAIAAT